MAPALPLLALDLLVDFILLLALGFLIVGIMRSLTPWLQKVPYVGGTLAGWVDNMAAAISRQCAKAVNTISHAVGVAFHAASRAIDHTYHQFRTHALALLELATFVGVLAHAIHAIRQLAEHASKVGAGIRYAVKTLQREYHGIEHRVKVLERDISKGIGHDLRIRIKALERWEAKTEAELTNVVQPGIRAAEREVARVEDWLGMEVGQVKKSWLVAFGTAVLAALGLSGLSCNSNPFKNNRNACGLWGDLAKILAAAGVFGAVVDFRDIVKAAVELDALGSDAIRALTVLDDAGIQDAAEAVAAAMRLVSS